MKTILAPIDFSPITEQVIAAAADLALTLDGRVVLLHVVVLPPNPEDFALALDRYSTLAETAEKSADTRLAACQATLADRSVRGETMRLTGLPRRLIPATAEKVNADFIIMGSHGHTALHDLVVGSTTHAVVRAAVCPVIIVPASAVAPVKQSAAPARQPAGA